MPPPTASLAPLRPRAAMAALPLALAAAFAVMPPSARAQAPTSAVVAYDIPPGPLAQTLNRFAQESGTAIVIDTAKAQGLQSPGLRGSYTPQDALNRLLASTGLAARTTPSGFVIDKTPAAASASAAAPAAATDNASVLGEVLVTAQRDDEQLTKDQTFQAARSTTVLSRDDIERSRGTSVGDIFKGTTGVLVGENRNSGGLDINIRGMQGQGRVPILVDGARQETTVYRGYSGVASRSYIDPDLIGGIQIDKGPIMSAEGTGATGGVVSMRTLNAEDITLPGSNFGLRLRGQAIGNNSGSPVAPGTTAGLHAAYGTYRADCVTASICTPALPGSWGNDDGLNRPGTFDLKSWSGSIAVAKRFESIDLVVAYAQRRQGNYYAGKHGPSAWMDISNRRKRPFYTEVYPSIQGATIFQAEERIPATNFASKSGMLKGKIYLPADQDLELSYLRYSSHYGELMPSQILRFSSLVPVSQPYDSDVTVDTYASRYRWNPEGSALIDLRANLWHTRTDSSNNNPFGDGLDIDGGVRQKYRRTGLDVSNTSALPMPQGWGESHLRYGAAFTTETVRPAYSQDTVPGNANMLGSNGDRDEYSAFAAWQYKPTSTVTFDAGLRYTHFRTHDSRDIVITDRTSPLCVDSDGDGACDPLPNRNKQSGTAPVVSIAWEPGNKGLQLYARYAEAYRMPSLFESTTGFSYQAKPDVILKPEHARNKEIGVNYLKDGLLRSNDKLRMKLAYFRNHTSDYLTRTSANLWEEGVVEGRSADFTMRNIDGATFNGLELSGSYDIGVAFAEFGATKYNKVEICHTGSYRINECNDYGIANSYVNNMVPPRWHANLTLGTRLLERRLTLGVRGTFMGQRNNTPQFNDDTAHGFLRPVPWHAYRVFDFFASYRVNNRVSVDFNVDNFTDRYYLDALSLGLIPAPGRTARLGVTLQF